MIVKGGAVALPGAARPEVLDLRIDGGVFVDIAAGLAPRPGEQVVDAAGLLVLPGGVDPHVHFDTPGYESRETFLYGSAEAARGGTTTVVDMPCTSVPPVVDLASLETKLAAVAPQALVDYGFHGGVRGGTDAYAAMGELAPRVLGFKCYLLSGMPTFPRVSLRELEAALDRAADLGRPLLLHAEAADYVDSYGFPSKEEATWDDYVDSRPEGAEVAACAAAAGLGYLGRRAGTLHVVHVGTAEAAEILSEAGATCETCAHYLAFSRDDFERLGSLLKTAPPVKAAGQAERLWALLADGAIAFVTSDHAPAAAAEKRTGSVLSDYGGIPGVGARYPYLVSEGYLAGRLGLARLLEAAASGAARRFGLSDRKGAIKPGLDADFVLVDPGRPDVLRADRLYSKGRDTPFDGFELRCSFRATYSRGEAVYDARREEQSRGAEPPRDGSAPPGIVAAPGRGRFLAWRPA